MQQQNRTDVSKARAFGERLFDIYTGGLLSLMVDIGHRTGLFGAAAQGPATSHELATRAGLSERYVREWLGAMVAAAVFDYDAATARYSLPPEHAVRLTGKTVYNMAPMSRVVSLLARHIDRVAEAFRNGGGVPYTEFGPEFAELMDEVNRRAYDAYLIRDYLTAAPELPQRLRRGIRVADIGCGSGYCVNLMARKYPASQFTGYDIDPDALARARREAEALGITNATFQVLDAACLPSEPQFDFITAFDAIHDQAAPAEVLKRIFQALAPGGIFLMVDINASSDLGGNLTNPMAPFLYSLSVLYCLTVSLAQAGAGLGALWGRETALRMLAQAGFSQIDLRDAPDHMNAIYICRK